MIFEARAGIIAIHHPIVLPSESYVRTVVKDYQRACLGSGADILEAGDAGTRFACSFLLTDQLGQLDVYNQLAKNPSLNAGTIQLSPIAELTDRQIRTALILWEISSKENVKRMFSFDKWRRPINRILEFYDQAVVHSLEQFLMEVGQQQAVAELTEFLTQSFSDQLVWGGGPHVWR